jgi:hypothetical protein
VKKRGVSASLWAECIAVAGHPGQDSRDGLGERGVEGGEHQASRRTGRVLEVGDDGRPIEWMADDPLNERPNASGSGKKICDGHSCGRICSEEWGNRGEVPSSSIVSEGTYLYVIFESESSLSSLGSSRRDYGPIDLRILTPSSVIREGNGPFH